MDAISGNQVTSSFQIDAMKKATEVESNSVLKVLDSIAPQNTQIQQTSSALTGLGQSIDIKA
jgi:hypothetical protein